jgi:hypothetical protein
MAGCWLLLKHPDNRKVLGNAFTTNPASSKLAQGMMQKLQDTVDVADVNEAVRRRLLASSIERRRLKGVRLCHNVRPRWCHGSAACDCRQRRS